MILAATSSLTAPPFPSFRKVSHTEIASLMSPKKVANSARRRCCGKEDEGPESELKPLTGLWITGEDGVVDEFDPPKSLLVVENNLEGNLFVAMYCITFSKVTTLQ